MCIARAGLDAAVCIRVTDDLFTIETREKTKRFINNYSKQLVAMLSKDAN